MKQSLIPLPRVPRLVSVSDVDGDLQVVGWDRADASAKTDGDWVDLVFENDVLTVRCDGALILYIPSGAALHIHNVERDLDLRAVMGDVRVENVGGDAQVRNVGRVAINNVARDLNARNINGDFTCANVGDDASIRQVRGAVTLGNVGSDLYLRDVDADISASVGSDAVLYWHARAGLTCRVTAGSDILLRVDGDVNASFSLQGGGPDAIRVDLPGVAPGDEAAQRTFTLGSGAAVIQLVAGGDVVVTSRAEEWESKVEFDTFSRDFGFTPGEFPSDFAGRIAQQAAETTRRALRHTQRAEAQSERVQRKVEAALRRAEEKIRAAERRSMHMGFSFGTSGSVPPRPPAPPRPPVPVSDPVSDEERLTILRMLQDKKISLQEAEKLLAALEGK